MGCVVWVPRRIVKEIERRGLCVEDVLVEVLAEKFNLDSQSVAEVRLELAEKYLEEARSYVERGDAVQASEKLYKVVEECVKALAELLNLPEVEKAKRLGRWFTWLLGSASSRASKVLGEPRIEFVWGIAYDLHVWGFHEVKYGIDVVEMRFPHIEWLLRYTKEKVKELSKGSQR